MTSVSEDRPSVEAALERTLERSMGAASIRPLPDLLADVAHGLVTEPAGTWAAIAVHAADGRAAVFVTAGDTIGTLSDEARASALARQAVPLMVRGRTAGALYLGGAAGDGPVGDVEASFAHAAAVGVGGLIERAHTVAANRRRERWLTGGTEIARALTTAHHADPMTMIAEQAAVIADADAVVVLAPGAAPGLLQVEAAAGLAAELAHQQIPDTDTGHVQRVFADGRAVRLDDLRAVVGPETSLPVDAVLLVPLHDSTGLRGVLGFGRLGRGPFSEAESGMAGMFAGTVALALELAETQSRREQTALLFERDRIARDLHDHVIQRLYALGLTVQHVSSSVSDEVADRLLAGVTDIDAAIAEIRSTIFRLGRPILGADVSLRARAEALVDELEPVLGFRATLVSEGPLDFGLDEDLMADCAAVLREAITNIARHAQASSADVRIAVGRDRVQIEIVDNGRGLGDSARRSGLDNLRRRAEQHGGTLVVGPVAGVGGEGGTRLMWTVPLPGVQF